MLPIKNIHIQNFKNVKDISIDFTRVNLISGDAGNGKSSILQALTLLLCNYVEGKMEDYVRWGQEEFKVECTFDYKGAEHTYWITYNHKKGTDRELTVDGEVYKKSDAYNYITENIIDPVLTLYSNIAEQGKSTSLLFETRAKSLEILKKILKIDQINKVVDNMKSDIKGNKQKVEILESEMNVLTNRNFEYLDVPEIKDIDVEAVNEEIKKLENDRDLYMEQKSQFNLYLEKKNTYENAQNKICSLERDLEDEKKLLEHYKPSRIARCKHTEDDINFLEYIGMELNYEIKGLDGKLDATETGECHVCGSKVSYSREDIVKQAEILKAQNTEVKEKLKEVKDEFVRYRNDNQANELKAEKYKNSQKTIKRIEQEIEELKAIQSVGSFEITASFDEEKYNSLRQDLQHYLVAIKEVENVKKLNEKTKKEQKETQLVIEQKLKEVDDIKRESQIINDSQKILNKDFCSYLIDTRTSYINDKMNDFFMTVYEGKYQIKFEQDSKGIGFYYSDKGSDWYSTITLSGFERQLFSIAFRLALTSLQDFRILVLDEIESEASIEKSLTLYGNLLSNEVSKHIDQFFAITHNEDTKEFISNMRDSKVFNIMQGELM